MTTLVLGGNRSGKSEVAERIAATLPPPVTVVVTATVDDPGMAGRIERHRERRPADWTTVEPGPGFDLLDVLRSVRGTVVVDSLGTWVAGLPDMEADGDALAEALHAREGDTVVVSDEVGLGVHPSTEAGLRFRDALGEVNQAVAAAADDVLLVVAGRVLRLGEPGA